LSHSKERAEKICLNCKAELHGRFCHNCGQENIEPKESIWGLIVHYFNDLTHFDGKFFSTLKYLMFRPGFLADEYVKGRRASYLNPIRMYIFTSAIFFIIFFTIYDEESVMGGGRGNDDTKDSVSLLNTKVKGDTIVTGNAAIDSILAEGQKEEKAERKNKKKADTSGNVKFSIRPDRYRSHAHYDSVQKALPADERDGWFQRIFNRRQISIREKYGDDDKTLIRVWLNLLIHQFPKLLFLSLPLVALILKLLYVRRKQFYYVDHVIWTVNLYIFGFILLLIGMGISYLGEVSGWGIFGWIIGGLWIYALYYNYKAMRVFYKQRRAKTIVKFILLNFMTQLTILILFTLFLVFTIFQL